MHESFKQLVILLYMQIPFFSNYPPLEPPTNTIKLWTPSRNSSVQIWYQKSDHSIQKGSILVHGTTIFVFM